MISLPERFSVGLAFGGELTTYLQSRTTAQLVLTSLLWGLVSTGMWSWQPMMRDPKHLGLVAQANQTLENGLKRKRTFFLICLLSPPFTTCIFLCSSWVCMKDHGFHIALCNRDSSAVVYAKKRKKTPQLNGNKSFSL